MFGSAILDVAIGIIFVFLLLSVFASTINEMILSLMNMRGKELLDGLKTLLSDSAGTGLVDKIYNHGQVFGLFKGNFDPKVTSNLPSYIPTQNFVLAMLDVIPDHAAAAPAQAPPPQPGQQPAVPPPGQQPVAPPPGQQPVAPAPAQQPVVPAADPLATLRAAAERLANQNGTDKVGKPLLAMIKAAGKDEAKLQKSLEDWYNSSMDRVSGWYKYKTQKILFVIGLVLAVFLNANTIKIVKQLSTDDTLRQSLVAAASSAKLPDNTAGKPIADQMKQAKEQVASINNLGIPLGWEGAAFSGFKDDLCPCRWRWIWLEDLIGWLLTALAISLGAPFWFDLLNRIMNARSTIKPGEEKPPPTPPAPAHPAA